MIELPKFHVKLSKADLVETKNFDQRLFRDEKEVRQRRLEMLATDMAGTPRLVMKAATADKTEAVFQQMPDHQRICDPLTETGQLMDVLGAFHRSMPLTIVVSGKAMEAPEMSLTMHNQVMEIYLGKQPKPKELEISKAEPKASSKKPATAKKPKKSTLKVA